MSSWRHSLALAFALLAVSSVAPNAAPDPAAELMQSAEAQGVLYLDYRGPQADGSCEAEAFTPVRTGREWSLNAESSEGVFRLRPWPENGPLHFTHNPVSGGFIVMKPIMEEVPDVVIFAPELRCPAGASETSDCEKLGEKLNALIHLISLDPVCTSGS